MSHFTECVSPGEESVEEMREGGREKGEPSCEWRVSSVVVERRLAKKYGNTLRVAFSYAVLVMIPISFLVVPFFVNLILAFSISWYTVGATC